MTDSEFETYFALRYRPFENTEQYFQNLTDDEIDYLWREIGEDLGLDRSGRGILIPRGWTRRKTLEVWIRINPPVQQQIIPTLRRYARHQPEQ